MLRAALLATVFLATPAIAAQPNIIVIMLDDVPDDLSIMPRTSELLPKGTRYTNSFVNQPLCSPSRATFLTGQESRTNGVINNDGFLSNLTGLVPQALRAVGYTTGMFGKNPNEYKGSVEAFGFDRWSIVMQINKRRYLDPKLDINGTETTFPAGTYTTDAIYTEARRWIAQDRSAPYFAWVSAVGGHGPNIPAPRYEGACDNVPFEPGPAFDEADVSDKPGFIRSLPRVSAAEAEEKFKLQCATIQADDEWIDRLVRRFAAPDTCVFLTSDNGFLLGQHRVSGKNYLYEESIRVPLVMWGCGAVEGGVDARLVSNVDLPATILELAGATPGRSLDGRSIFGRRRANVPLTGMWDDTPGSERYSTGVRDARWSYLEHDTGEQELYDLGADPAQLDSVHSAPAHRDRVRRMRKAMGPRP